MSYHAMQVLDPVIGLMVNVLIQILGSRFLPGLGMLKSVILGFITGGLSVILTELYLLVGSGMPIGDALGNIVTNLIIYACLGYCYFHFINLGETARRIRILRELYDSKEGLSMEEILKRYNARDIVKIRINRLVNNGQIIFKNNRYYIGKPIMLLMAKIIIRMKLMVLGKESEFD